MAGISMLQQGEQQRQQRKNDQASMMANAAAMEYSPWTGMQTQMQGPKATGGMGSILGAGAQGAMMGAMFNQANTKPGTKPSIYKPKTAEEELLLRNQWQGDKTNTISNTLGPKLPSWFGVLG